MIESFFDSVGLFCINLLFFDLVAPFHLPFKMPFFTTFVLGASVYLMFALRFINITRFWDSIKYLLGKKVNEDASLKNAIPARSAFLTATTGCFGVGSISGVAAAVFIGGPGVALWIPICGLLTMPLRYAEVFLGHYFRKVDDKGMITEFGPYAYLRRAGEVIGYSKKTSLYFINTFAILFLIATIGACWMQSNPIIHVFSNAISEEHAHDYYWIVGLILAILTFVIIAGGFKRVVDAVSGLGIVMAGAYVLSVGAVLFTHSHMIFEAFRIIIDSAFSWKSVYGGALATMMVSLQRGTIASEVGLGTTPLLHGRSNSKSSVDEGIMAMFGPFFGLTLFFFCNALALVASGAYTHTTGDIIMVKKAFVTVAPWFNYVLVAVVFLFGFTTILAWYYYAESGLRRFTDKKVYITMLQLFYPILIFISGFATFTSLLRLIDFTTLVMAIPNILAVLILSRAASSEYKKYRAKK